MVNQTDSSGSPGSFWHGNHKAVVLFVIS